MDEHDLALVVAFAFDGAAREADEYGERRKQLLLVGRERAQLWHVYGGEEPLYGVAQLRPHRRRVGSA